MIVSVNNKVDKVLTLTFVHDEASKTHTSTVLIGSKYNISYKKITKNGTTVVSAVGKIKAFTIDDTMRERTLPASFQKPSSDMVVTISVDCSTEFNSNIIDIKTYDLTDIKCLDPVIITPEVIDGVMATNTLCEYDSLSMKTNIKFRDSDRIFSVPTTTKMVGV